VERKVLSVLSGSALLECFVSEVLDSGGTSGMWIRSARDSPACGGTRAKRSSPAGIIFESVGGEGIFLWGRVPDATPVDDLVRVRATNRSCWRGLIVLALARLRSWLRFNVAHSASAPLVRFLSDSLRIAA